MSVTPLNRPQLRSAPAQAPAAVKTTGPPSVPLAGDRVARDSAPPSKHGFGIGFLGAASAEAGLRAGVGATAAAGAGLFYDGARGVHPGAYAGAGAFAGAGDRAAKTPHTADAVAALGAFAGAGVGVFVTNAASATQLGGTAQTYSCNVGVGPLKLSVQLGMRDGIDIGAASIGPGIGLDVSRYPTQTVTTPR